MGPNQCSRNCPAGQTNNQLDNTCLTCHSSCLTCKGSLNTDCFSCSPGKYLGSLGECLGCHSDCGTCSGPNQDDCLTCADPKKVILSLPAKGACTLCSGNQYKLDNKTCGDCHSDCQNCTGGSSSECLACSGNKVNKNWPLPSSCSTCQSNEFKSDEKTCSSCHSSCLTCSGT